VTAYLRGTAADYYEKVRDVVGQWD